MHLEFLGLGVVAASEWLCGVRGVPEGGVGVEGTGEGLGGCLGRGGGGGFVDLGAALGEEGEARGGREEQGEGDVVGGEEAAAVG